MGTGGRDRRLAPVRGGDLQPGAYEAVLADGTRARSSRAAPCWIVDPGAGATLTVADEIVGDGEPDRRFVGGDPGQPVGLARGLRQGADPNVASYLLWEYTAATIEGATTFGTGLRGSVAARAGAYTVYLLEDDCYEALAGADFTVEE